MVYDVLLAYDMKQSQWRQFIIKSEDKKNSPYSRQAHFSYLSEIDKRIYVIGGFDLKEKKQLNDIAYLDLEQLDQAKNREKGKEKA